MKKASWVTHATSMLPFTTLQSAGIMSRSSLVAMLYTPVLGGVHAAGDSYEDSEADGDMVGVNRNSVESVGVDWAYTVTDTQCVRGCACMDATKKRR